MIIRLALLGFVAVLLAACAAPNRHSDWHTITRETGRVLNR
jgi:hypothetical protein